MGLEGVLGHRVDRRVLVGGRGHLGLRVVRVNQGHRGHKVVQGLGGVLGLVGGRVRLGPQDLLDRLD